MDGLRTAGGAAVLALVLALASGCASVTTASGRGGGFEWTFADVALDGGSGAAHVGSFRFAREPGAPAGGARLGERRLRVWRDADGDGRRGPAEPVLFEASGSAPAAAFEVGAFDLPPGAGALRCDVTVRASDGAPLFAATRTIG